MHGTTTPPWCLRGWRSFEVSSAGAESPNLGAGPRMLHSPRTGFGNLQEVTYRWARAPMRRGCGALHACRRQRLLEQPDPTGSGASCPVTRGSLLQPQWSEREQKRHLQVLLGAQPRLLQKCKRLLLSHDCAPPEVGTTCGFQSLLLLAVDYTARRLQRFRLFGKATASVARCTIKSDSNSNRDN